jgi:hypothetical protein
LTKIGFALAAVVPYVVLEFLWEFDISLGIENSTSSKMAIFYIYTFGPIIKLFYSCKFIIFSFLNPEEKYAKFKGKFKNLNNE